MRRRRVRGIVLLLLASVAGTAVFAVVYWRGGQPQLEAVGLGVALAGLGGGLALWSKRLMPDEDTVEERPDLRPPASEEAATAATFRDRGRAVGRRGLLGGLAAFAGSTLALVVLWPFRSLGPRPGRALRTTPWAPGVRVVDSRGMPVRVDAVPEGGLVTVFPEGHTDAADAQTVLLRVRPADLLPQPGREDWSPEGYLAYSKVCTHAGCPVGLYQRDDHVLLCPCHQASFDVLDGARPVFGPAPRPLPQLPLSVDAEGYLVARGDFPEPVGPAWWGLGGGADEPA